MDDEERSPDRDEAARRQAVQARIDRALIRREPEANAAAFSPFLRTDPEPLIRLQQAAARGGLEGLEAAMDELDRLAETRDPQELWWALNVFLAHYPTGEAGISVPSFPDQVPWQFAPGRR